MKLQFTGLSETLLIPLWARAVETKRSDSIIKDYDALEMMEKIEYDFSRFSSIWVSQVGVAVRTKILDEAVREFIRVYPDAVIINLGAGLGTRYHRVDNSKIKWYDLDLPDVIRLKRAFYKETDRFLYIEKSAFDYSWIDEVELDGRPVLFIAEGLLMYFTENEVKELFDTIVDEFKQSELLFEMMAPAMIGMSRHHDCMKKLAADDIEFKWSMNCSKDLEQWNRHIKFLHEWNIFDYYRERWRWMTCLITMTPFKYLMGNRIVHLMIE